MVEEEASLVFGDDCEGRARDRLLYFEGFRDSLDESRRACTKRTVEGNDGTSRQMFAELPAEGDRLFGRAYGYLFQSKVLRRLSYDGPVGGVNRSRKRMN